MGFAEISWDRSSAAGTLTKPKGSALDSLCGAPAASAREAKRLARRALGKRAAGEATVAPALDGFRIPEAARPVIVASHRRSGTHLMIDLLRRQFEACDAWKWPAEGLDVLYTDLDRLGRHRRPLVADRLHARLARAAAPLFKTHLRPDFGPVADAQREFIAHLRHRARVIYTVRDGRAVLVSARLHEQRLGLDVGDTLLDYLQLERDGESRVRAWARHVEEWMSSEGVLVVRYEDVVSQTARTLARVGEFLGHDARMRQPLAPPLVRGTWQKRALRLTHRRPPTTALTPPTASRPWREQYGPEEQAVFEREAGAVMRKLGYVDDALES